MDYCVICGAELPCEGYMLCYKCMKEGEQRGDCHFYSCGYCSYNDRECDGMCHMFTPKREGDED